MGFIQKHRIEAEYMALSQVKRQKNKHGINMN